MIPDGCVVPDVCDDRDRDVAVAGNELARSSKSKSGPGMKDLSSWTTSVLPLTSYQLANGFVLGIRAEEDKNDYELFAIGGVVGIVEMMI